MREIKFRMWNPGTLAMEAVTGFHIATDTGFLYVQNHEPGAYSYNTTPIMQYTGLKDKNGKEIYEGDIIRVTAILDASKSFIAPVEWNIEQGTLEAGYSVGFRTIGAVNRQCEVVGNIYQDKHLLENENPELLEPDQGA